MDRIFRIVIDLVCIFYLTVGICSLIYDEYHDDFYDRYAPTDDE